MIAIRFATPADAPVLSAFAARTFREAFAPMVAPDAMETYLAQSFPEASVRTELADPRSVFVIATTDAGEWAGYAKLFFGGDGCPPVGCAPLCPPDCPPAPPAVRQLPSSNRVKLWRLYTAREHQGRGVGAALLERAARVARDRGGATLWLTVNTGNTGAVRFYERHGFVRTGFTSFNLGGEVQHDFLMERSLSR